MDHHHGKEVKVFCGSANRELARDIARSQSLRLGNLEVSKFSNGETRVTIEESVRSMHVFVIQPICADTAAGLSVNDSLMELFLVIGDACKRASCKRLVAVIPFYAYGRQSKKSISRTPITAKLIANMIQAAGYQRIITLDLHASQIQGFWDIPCDNIFMEPLILKYIRKRIPGEIVVVGPGVGGVKRAKAIADKLDTALVILHKQVSGDKVTAEMDIVGDPKGKIALIIDDIADTCETLQLATKTLLNQGAKEVYAFVSHGILSGNSLERINECGLTQLIISNSIPLGDKAASCPKIKVINIASLLSEAIRRTQHGESVSNLFNFRDSAV